MRSGTVLTAVLACALVGTGCGKSGDGSGAPAAAPKKTEQADDNGFVGVDPLIFKCESITPVADIARLVEGAVEQVEDPFRPPKGTPPPCNYQLTEARALPEHQFGEAPGDKDFKVKLDAGPPAPAQWMWSVAYDCREGAHKSARRDMERLVGEESAVEVSVGSYGIDAKGSALMFFDEDSPCWVRVTGPGSYRLAIAQYVERKLQARNAPMRPRAAR